MATQLQQFLGSLRYGRRRDYSIAQPTFGRVSAGAVAFGSQTIGAAAVGAFAFGAVAIGALAIRQLAVKRARIQRLEIGELVVDRLVVRQSKGLRPDIAADRDGEEPELFDMPPRGSNGAHRRAHRTASTLKPGDEAAAGTSGTAENICPDCNGTGLVDDAACGNCDGTGRVVEGLAGG
jgi:hypothetical protein